MVVGRSGAGSSVGSDGFLHMNQIVLKVTKNRIREQPTYIMMPGTAHWAKTRAVSTEKKTFLEVDFENVILYEGGEGVVVSKVSAGR